MTIVDGQTGVEQPGVTVWYRAMQERRDERGSGWGSDYHTPHEALMFLSLRLGLTEDIGFDDKMATVRERDEEPGAITEPWRVFTAAVMAEGTGVVELGRYRWRVDCERLECIDGPGRECEGSVNWHSLDPGVRPANPYCWKHWGDRCDREQELRERYPYHAPADFDPMYAGEYWGEDY